MRMWILPRGCARVQDDDMISFTPPWDVLLAMLEVLRNPRARENQTPLKRGSV